MNCNVLTIPQFEKDVKKLAKKFKAIKKDLFNLISELQEEPTQGTSLGNGLYKLRLANSSIPRGKSGGFRVITYFIDDENNLYLLSIYSKTEKENISDEELKEALKFFDA
ncbi:MAG: Unknown protein [uncultured Sulfurovum sp.]|uniref:Uncharacterized protein n=1 Tax=uncultured Sulfurovum sp. TaxID=269237 RepID=A0A6S6TQ83_9BACT|nr:MAG: Unknown protein [uncultured Sulfurovum sp.]